MRVTDRQIAEQLVISERTVEGHVEQLRNKLGLRSRALIAVWATEARPLPGTRAPRHARSHADQPATSEA